MLQRNCHEVLDIKVYMEKFMQSGVEKPLFPSLYENVLVIEPIHISISQKLQVLMQHDMCIR